MASEAEAQSNYFPFGAKEEIERMEKQLTLVKSLMGEGTLSEEQARTCAESMAHIELHSGMLYESLRDRLDLGPTPEVAGATRPIYSHEPGTHMTQHFEN